MPDHRTITILGSTATGKTTIAVHLAVCLDGEVISADSRQVYKGMDIGTGKDLSEYIVDGKQIPYHLIDIVKPGYQYNVFEYQQDFIKAYQSVSKKSKTPVLCGGSGMYIEAVLKGYRLTSVPVNDLLRKELENYPMDALEKRLKSLKAIHNRSDLDTKKRAIRAIEIAEYEKSHPVSEVQVTPPESLIIGIYFEREERRKRIEQRLHARLKEGMVEEVEELMRNELSPEQLVYYGLEYKWITLYLLGELTYKEMVQKLLVAIHQFAKRQMTWFRKMEKNDFQIHWINGRMPLKKKSEKIIGLYKTF